jgi:hypothetical protein
MLPKLWETNRSISQFDFLGLSWRLLSDACGACDLLLSRTVPQSFLWFQGLSLPVPIFSVSCLLLNCWLWNLYNLICRSSLNCFQVEIKFKHGEFLSSYGDMYFFGVWEWYGCKVLGLHVLPCFLGRASISWWTATAAFVLNGRGQGCRKSTCSYKMEVL